MVGPLAHLWTLQAKFKPTREVEALFVFNPLRKIEEQLDQIKDVRAKYSSASMNYRFLFGGVLTNVRMTKHLPIGWGILCEVETPRTQAAKTRYGNNIDIGNSSSGKFDPKSGDVTAWDCARRETMEEIRIELPVKHPYEEQRDLRVKYGITRLPFLSHGLQTSWYVFILIVVPS